MFPLTLAITLRVNVARSTVSLLFYHWFESRVKSKWGRGNRCNIAANAASSSSSLSLSLCFFSLCPLSPCLLSLFSRRKILLPPASLSSIVRKMRTWLRKKESEKQRNPSLREICDRPPMFGPPSSTWRNFLLYSFILSYQWSVFKSSPVFIHQFKFSTIHSSPESHLFLYFFPYFIRESFLMIYIYCITDKCNREVKRERKRGRKEKEQSGHSIPAAATRVWNLKWKLQQRSHDEHEAETLCACATGKRSNSESKLCLRLVHFSRCFSWLCLFLSLGKFKQPTQASLSLLLTLLFAISLSPLFCACCQCECQAASQSA